MQRNVKSPKVTRTELVFMLTFQVIRLTPIWRLLISRLQVRFLYGSPVKDMGWLQTSQPIFCFWEWKGTGQMIEAVHPMRTNRIVSPFPETLTGDKYLSTCA